MKKVLLFLALTVVVLMCFASCSMDQPQTPPSEHTHNFGEWETSKNATCSSEGEMIRYCSCGESQSKTVSMLAHNEVIDEAVEASCGKAGLTKGKHCSVCDTVIVAQEEIPAKTHIYDDEYDAICNICDHKRDVNCPHDETKILEAKSASCTETGLTEGLKCEKCGETLTAQETVPMTEHTESSWIVDEEATQNKDGKRHTECTVCGQTMKEEILYATGSVGLEYTIKADGQSYFVAGRGTCTDTEIVISGTYNGLPVTSIGGNAFYDCDWLTSITIPKSITSIAAYAFYDCNSITSIEIPDSVISIGDYAFAYSSLTSISIPNSVTNIGYYAFGSSLLKNVVLPDSITSISDKCFYTCASLTSVTIPDSVTSIGDYAFYGCTSLASITIPNSVTSIGAYAFSYTLLSNITIPDSVTSIGIYAFCNCTSLKSVTMFNGVKNIGSSAFDGTKITNVYYVGDLADWLGISFASVTANPLNYGANLFFDGELVTDITIPDSVTSIGFGTFYCCRSLTSVVIPDSVTSIGKYAFDGCYSLKSVIIPDSVTGIGYYAFYSCTSLTIYCEASSKPSGWHSDWNRSNCPVVWGYKGE